VRREKGREGVERERWVWLGIWRGECAGDGDFSRGDEKETKVGCRERVWRIGAKDRREEQEDVEARTWRRHGGSMEAAVSRTLREFERSEGIGSPIQRYEEGLRRREY